MLLSLFAVIAPAKAEPHAVAVLQTLDKVTARVNTIDVRVGGTVRFGTLLIRVDHCDKRPPEETPESTDQSHSLILAVLPSSPLRLSCP